MALSYQTVSKILTELPTFEFQSVRRSFQRNLAENSEAASFLGQTTSFETEVQEREPWNFYEWITCNEKPRCAPNKKALIHKTLTGILVGVGHL